METKTIGIISILLASIMWAIEPIFAKLAYQQSDFLPTIMFRALITTLIALLYITIRKKTATLKLSKKQIPPILYIAIMGTLVADLLYLYALTQIPVINAVLIGHMQPMFIILISFFILKDDIPSRYDYLGIIIMILSGLLVTSKTIERLLTLSIGTYGDVIVLTATIVWSTSAITMRKYLRTIDAGTLSFYRFLLASIALLSVLIIFQNNFTFSYYQIYVGITVGIGTILYYEGLKRIKAAQVSALELATPFFAAILGIIILNELVTTLQILGILLLIFGIYFLSKKEPKPTKFIKNS